MRFTIAARFMLLVATTLVVAACGGDNSADTSTSVATTTTTTSTVAPETTTSTAPPTTTSPTTAPPSGQALPGEVDAALTVAGPDGAFLVENSFVFQLVDGPVELAIADGEGGLVFQRTSDTGLRDPNATIISFLPADSFDTQDLLVPTGDQYLRLWDVEDGVVWYTRTEGDSPETARETLRTYSQATRSVDEFASTGGWESGSIGISVGGPNVAVYWGAEGTTGFSFYDEGSGFVSFDGDPYGPDVFCGDGTLYDVSTGDLVGTACFEFAELSDDGRLAFYERDFDGAGTRYVLVVVDLDTGEEVFRQDLERPDQGWAPLGMDLRGDQVIVNRTATGEYGAPYIDAFLIDLTSGSVTEIGIDGQARFLVGPMGID